MLNKTPLADTQETTFESLVLHHQDEVFTLAYYILGDEERAVQAVQMAIQLVLRKSMNRAGRVRLELLRQTLWQARKVRAGIAVQPKLAGDPLCARLALLTENERTAAVLVDVLGLSYNDAARVLDCTPRQAGKFLAQARLTISRQMRVQ
jgi:DNA-directed RNA polymerase specialized sigma24 family protein